MAAGCYFWSMCPINAAQHVLCAASPGGGSTPSWMGPVLIALIPIALGFWNWRAGVKAALVLVLFEGMLRKQVMPAAQELNYALKDLLLVGAYLRFFLVPDEAVRQSRLLIGKGARWLIILAVCVVSLDAPWPGVGSPWATLFGLMLYLFYLPLVVMMPRLYSSGEDVRRGLRRFAWLALPVCCAGLYQWWVPGVSYLSVYASGLMSLPRMLGTFSYVTGFTAFLSLFFGLHLGLLFCSQPGWTRWALLMNLGLLITCCVLSESRSAMAQMILWVVLLPGCMMLMRRARRFRLASALGLFLMLAGAALAARHWQMGAARDAVSLMHAVRETPLSGNGIAATHPRMESLRRFLRLPQPPKKAPVYDSEPASIYSELGLAGFGAWYLLRLTLLVLSVWFAWGGRNDDLSPLRLVFVLAQLFSLFGPFVFNATTGLLVTAAAGMAMKIERVPAGR